MAGFETEQAKCTHLGLKIGEIRDRMWFLFNKKRETFCDLARVPRLVLLLPSIVDGNKLHVKNLQDDNMRPLEIDIIKKKANYQPEFIKCRIFSKMVDGVDVGDAAARWIKEFVKDADLDLRLLQAADRLKDIPAYDPETYHFFEPYHLISTESVEDLNKRFRNEPVSYKTFRANIVIEPLPDKKIAPYMEDNWRQIKIGNVEFIVTSPFDRSSRVNVNPETGEERGDQVLHELRKYRLAKTPEMKRKFGGAPLFGINLILKEKNIFKEPETISVGDLVYAFPAF